jgi:NAD(P)-dependent dehydrogenase (short-subunit alcohol dehydrogenase family)
MANPFSLEGKTILVTGASSGIGRQTAIECSRMGASVVLTARNEDRLNETLNAMSGTNHSIVAADLLKQEDLDSLLCSVPELNGVVLCSGKGLTLPMQFATRDKFDDIFCTNFYSPFELLRLLYKKKKLQKNGSVVTIASLGGIQIFSGGNGVYGVSKAALASAMMFCAKEFAPRKVRVNCICPGMVDTPLIHRGTVTEEQLKENEKLYPLGRYGKPEDIAYAAVYLLSDAASWITGQQIVLDGGISIK